MCKERQLPLICTCSFFLSLSLSLSLDLRVFTMHPPSLVQVASSSTSLLPSSIWTLGIGSCRPSGHTQAALARLITGVLAHTCSLFAITVSVCLKLMMTCNKQPFFKSNNSNKPDKIVSLWVSECCCLAQVVDHSHHHQYLFCLTFFFPSQRTITHTHRPICWRHRQM